MALSRHLLGPGVRDELFDLEETMLGYAELFGDEREAVRCRARLVALCSQRAVTVAHGWEIGLSPDTGPYRLEADDTVTLLDRADTAITSS